MKKAVWLVLALSLFLTGCTSKKAALDGATETESEAMIDTDSRYLDLVGMLSNHDSYSYTETIKSSKGTVSTAKTYVKGTKMRRETEVEGQQVITVGDLNGDLYVYNQDADMAMKIGVGDLDTSQKDLVSMAEDYSDQVSFVKEEMLNGVKAALFTVDDQEGEVKLWFDADQGFPLKFSVTTPAGEQVIEYSDYQFDDISDEMFAPPEDLKILTLPGAEE